MPRCPAAVLAVVALSLGGCAGGEPAGPEPLVAISGPAGFESFELRDGRQVLWRLVAREPAPLTELVYGVVPAGFRQETPAGAAAPRELVVGELLYLESTTPSRIFRHEGFVVSGQRLSIDAWQMELRQPPAAPRLDEPPAPS